MKRDLNREAKGPPRQTLQREFVRLIEALANDQPLAHKYRDHALGGDWKDHRDCHIKPDLVLIYRKPDDVVLQLFPGLYAPAQAGGIRQSVRRG